MFLWRLSIWLTTTEISQITRRTTGQTLLRGFLPVLRLVVVTERRIGKMTPPPPPLPPTMSTQDPNYTGSPVPSPTSTSSRTPWLTAASLARSTKDRRTRYLMKWRNPKPITSWCYSVMVDASSGLCTHTAPRRRRSPNWLASGRGASRPR